MVAPSVRSSSSSAVVPTEQGRMHVKVEEYVRTTALETILKTGEDNWESPLGADNGSKKPTDTTLCADWEARAAAPSLKPKTHLPT